MENIKYRIVFKGEINDNFDIDEVKNSLSSYLKIDTKTVEKLFSGNKIVIKKGLDISSAKKIEQIFDKSGAVCHIEEELPDSVKDKITNSIPDSNSNISDSQNISDNHKEYPDKNSLIPSETRPSNPNHNKVSKINIFIKYLFISLFFISVWYIFSFVKAFLFTICLCIYIYFSDTIQKIAEKIWYNKIYIISSLKDIMANVFLRFKEKSAFLSPRNYFFIFCGNNFLSDIFI